MLDGTKASKDSWTCYNLWLECPRYDLAIDTDSTVSISKSSINWIN